MSLLLSAKVRRISQNELLGQILDIGYVIGPTFGFKIRSNLNQE